MEKYLFVCTVKGHEFSDETDCHIASWEDVETYLQNERVDWLLELKNDAINEDTPIPCGMFPSEEVIFKELYANALDYIYTVSGESGLFSYIVDENGSIIESREWSLYQYMTRYFSELETAEQSTIDACQYVEACLAEFVSNSCWQYGLQRSNGEIITQEKDWPVPSIDINGEPVWYCNSEEWKPIIWFGIQDAPRHPLWTLGISKDTDFWFCDQEWEQLEFIVEAAGTSFLTWYTAECGLSTFDIDEIVSTCPIEICEDAVVTNRRVRDFVLHKQMSFR